MKYLFTILFIVLTANLFAGEGETYLQKINQNYRGLASFELTINYKLYKGHNGSEIMDEYTSTLSKNGKQSYRKMYNEEIITSDEMSLVINHNLRTIQILPPIEEQIFENDIQNSLAFCQDIKIKETTNGKQLSITFKKHSTLPYSRIDLNIDNNFWVTDMTFFYASQLNYSNDFFSPDMDNPRLKVTYESLKKKWKDKTNLTDLSKYIVNQDSTYQPSSLYQGYSIID